MNKNNIKPWLVLVVCCGLAASSIGISINSSGVFYTPVSEDLGIMRGTFSMHMTIFSIVTAMSALIVPKIMNKFSYFLNNLRYYTLYSYIFLTFLYFIY